MMAPESRPRAYLVSATGALPKPIAAEIEEEGPTLARSTSVRPSPGRRCLLTDPYHRRLHWQ